MGLNRVVVTGVAAVTPIGNDVRTSWDNLLAGVSGVAPVSRFDAAEHATKFAAEVKGFDPLKFFSAKQAKRMEYFSMYAAACSIMVLESAGLKITPEDAPNVGVIMGCGMGSLELIDFSINKIREDGPSRVSPFFIPMIIPNIAAGQASIFSGAMGPNLATSSACASGLHAIGYAYTDVMLGRVQAMICGGVESTINYMAMAGFNAMRALSTRNDNPQAASRPFDRDRDGFVMGEGSGVLFIETLERAKARGANILAEIVGYGASSDAFHIAAPREDGRGMALAMRAALREAKVSPQDIDHINAHGTSTPLNDATETRAIKEVFGPHAYNIAITANKSMIGHTLGGAGGIESVFSVLSLSEGVIPGTINLQNPDPECDLDYCAGGTRRKQVNYVMNNSFGFGGTNCSLLFKRYED